MKNRFWLACLSLSLLGFSAQASDLVISEIMYHPFHTAAEAEDTGREWVELFNRGTNTVSLHNWKLAKAIEFTFTNVSLAPGRYLVIAASRTNFLARYPGVTNVLGDWEGKLSNIEDEIRLIDHTGETVSTVPYADSGEWAIRARASADAFGLRGWDWLAPHDGGGMSLELVNPTMPSVYGQNWAASAVNGGTPGAVNSILAANTAPFIQNVTHFPLVPRSTEAVTVTARIEDEQTNGVSATLFYRGANSTTPPAFLPLTMFDDGEHGDDSAGDGVFGAIIPAQQVGTVVEFYVSAADGGARTRRWPAPAQNSPDLGGGVLPPESGANALYQVDDTSYSGTQPFYRMIMTESERAFLASIAGSFRNSDASAHGTFVSMNANGTEEHHSASFRRRGAGSRGSAIFNYRVNFAADRRWKGRTAINLNSQYTHAQIAGSVFAALSGLHAELQQPVQLRVNGANLANAGSPQFGSFAEAEVPDGDYANRHFPDDPNGNIYRASSGAHSATLAYLGTNPNAYISAGYSKTANGSEYDWSDLINLTDVLNNTPASNYVAAMLTRVNVPQWMTYFAVFTLLDSKETSLGIGVGDDFAMYRGEFDPRFLLLGHDFDTVFGQGDTPGNVNDSIFRAVAVPVIDRFLKHPEFAPLYYQTLTNLIATAFSPGQVSSALDQHLGSWVNAGVIGNMKTFSAARNAGVLAQIPLTLTVNASLPNQNGYPRSTGNTATLFGFANAVETRSILINGVAANWSAWEARWTGTATLLPGINRVLVQSLDASGREFDRTYLDVWYDSGVVVNVSNDINDAETWTAAGGPYYVTGPITIPDGGDLTIQPGTTVYFAPGAGITLNDTGRLRAQGTETQRIRFGRNPAQGGTWRGLSFIGAPGDNRLAYVDFDSVGGANIGGRTAQIHVNGNSRIFIDHCTWPSTPAVQYISFDRSSFIVQHCVFPSYPAPVPASAGQPEMLHGVNGIPAGGYGIFRDNYFGRTWGFNDTIDFTGGQRPSAILQIIGNVFDGAGDDHLDLDSTDAWIEGNIFMHAHRDPARTDNPLDTSSAISGGVDVLGQNADWTIINNLFYDVDHVFLNKGNSTSTGNAGGRVAFLYNTVSHVAAENSGTPASQISVFNWSDNNVVLPDPAIGSGLYAAYNIVHDAPVLHRFYNPANLNVIMDKNIFPVAFKGTTNEWTGPGSGNLYVDPRLNLGALNGIAVSNVTATQLRSAFQLRPGSPALGAGFGNRDLGGLGAYGIAISGEPEGTNITTSATVTVGPGGTFNWGTNAPQPWGWTAFRWRLDNGPWSDAIPFTNESPFTTLPTITVSNLSDGPHTIYVSGQNDAGYFQDDPFVYPTNSAGRGLATTSRTWTVDTTLSRLVINEVLARNTTQIIDGKVSDLIELHNAGANAVNLAGLSVTDDPAQPRKFVFPPGTTIGPGEYLLLIAANGETPGRIYTGFALNDAGEGVYLYDRPANGGRLLDSVVFGLQLPDFSIGRLADGTWGLTQPTFGAANRAQAVGDPFQLRINEWLAASGEIFQQDFIEIYNTDPVPVALGGLALSSSPISSPRQSIIPALSFIAGRGWQSFVADGDSSAGADQVNFNLPSEGGWIGLAATNGTMIDMVVYVSQFPDITQGRSPDGGATFVSFNQPTPGAGNPGQTVTVTPVMTTIVPINQVWRMEASGVNLGTAWRANNYDDSGWFSGPALFYNFDGGGGQLPPIPAQSVIPFTNPKQTTVYFRTSFNYTGQLSGLNFVLSQVIDDACVLYLNNQEIYRFNFTPGQLVTYGTFASTGVGGAPSLLSGIPIALTNLVAGTNYLAIEVHQQSSASSDMAMAIQIDSQQLVTNYLGTPIVLNEVFTKNDSYTNASGRIVDWVELYNPSPNVVDISDLSLSDDPTIPRRWVFPQGAAISPGGYYVVEFDDSEPYSPFNAGFELSADSGAVYLFNRPLGGGALIDVVVYGVQVADLTLSRATPGQNNSWTLGAPTRGAMNSLVPLGSTATLKVNEWMPNPVAGEDDWFEIYNPDPRPVALGGLHLTDESSNPVKHKVRPLSFIGTGPEAYLKIIADDDTASGADHVNFRLGNTESISIYTSNAVPARIDSVSYVSAQNGLSYGRLPDGSSNLVSFPNSASPEDMNWLPLLGTVVINEILTRPFGATEQAIELRNLSDVDVAIGGWYLSNARKDLKRFPIPGDAFVPAGGFKVFYEAQFNPNNDLPPSFAFNSFKNDELYLSVADANGNLTGYRTSASFGAAAAGASFGRYEKSTGDDFVAMTARTFGVNNPSTVAQFRTGTGTSNAYPAVGPVVINELHYHPPDLAGGVDDTESEFIEILNASAAAVALYDVARPTNTWRLRDAVDFNFPTNTVIPAYDYLLVVGFDPSTNAAALARFRTRYGVASSTRILGPWNGKLDNSTDSVELLRPDAPVPPPHPDAGSVPYILVERVKYSDSWPWPSAADGTVIGVDVSLQRMVGLEYGNDPVNWIAGVPTPSGETGTSGGQAPTINVAPTNRVAMAGNTVVLTVTATGASPLLYQWRLNGTAVANATNASLTLANVQGAQAGLYTVVVANRWGAALAGPARLTVQAPPQFSQQPQSRTVNAGSETTFAVSASGGSLQYQWRFNGTNIPNATFAALTLTNVQPANEGNYDVLVSNGLGTSTSVVATLTVLVRPSFTSQPQSISAIIGNTVGFTAGAQGTAPLLYQWRLNGTNLVAATNSSLTFSNVQPANAGNYILVVANGAGAITSSVATLTVIVPPTVTVSSRNATATEPGADTGSFSFTRTGSTTSVLRVNYAISGSATAGSDYAALSGRVEIPIGAATAHVVLTALDDSLFEGDETVTVTLLSHLDYLLGAPSGGTVVIKDDDNLRPAISILTPTNTQVFPNTPVNVSFTVSVNDPDGAVVKVEYFTDVTNKLGETTSPPFDFTWTNAPAGTNTLTARATDNLGSTTMSLPVTVLLNGGPTVAIVSPVNGSIFSVPASIAISTAVADTDGGVVRVDFYNGTSLFASVSNAPFNTVFNTSALGGYALRAVAVDNLGARATSAVVNVSVNSATVVFTDAFANRPTISGYTNSATGNNTSATREVGEPVAYNGSTRTVWIQWIAPANGPCTIDLCGSSFDTVLAVYINTSGGAPNVATLTQVAQDDDGSSCGNNNSRVTFSAQAGVAYQIRVEGFSTASSGTIACSLTLIPTTGPPFIVTPPADQFASVGGSAVFSVGVSGGSPFRYQWRFFGTNLPNATNATLTLNNLTTNQAGPYSVLVTNASGSALSAAGLLTIIQAGNEYFRIVSMTSNNAATLEHYQLTGFDPENGQYGRGGIAVSSSQVIVNAGNTAARFSAANLTGGTALNVVYDALITDLATERVYCFGIDSFTPAISSRQSTTLTHLLELNGATGLLTGAATPLTAPIILRGSFGNYGFFSGYGRAVILVGREAFHVALPSGAVASLGATTNVQHTATINWGYWGLVESTDAGLWLVYARNSQNIARTHLASGATTNFASFSNLGFYNASMSFSVPRSRWYFDHYSSSQFASGIQRVGYADAQFILSGSGNIAPTIIVPPQNVQALVGGRAAFSVSAIGGGSLGYQWRFNNTNLPGAVASAYSILDVQPGRVGSYSVVVSNAFGSVTTAPVALSIALPPSVTTNPVSRIVAAGETVTFTVSHTGDGPFYYQWKFNGSDLLNATNRNITFPADYYDNGSYYVEVRNAVGVAFSAPADLVVNAPPFFNAQPVTRDLLPGMNATFAPLVDGTPEIAFQWLKNGVAIPGATNMRLVIPNIGSADVASYRLTATNLYGSVTSVVASVNLLPLETNSFAIGSLGTNGLIVSNVYPIVGSPDYNGIAASGNRVFLNGYGQSGEGPAGSFSAHDLSGGTSVGGLRNGLVSDFKTRKVYSLANGATLIGTSGGTVNTLVELDGMTGQPTGTSIPLSTSVTLQSFYCAIFSGYGRIMLMDSSSRLYDIAIPSGQVTTRGTMNTFNYNYALGFAYRGWGVVEQIGTNIWLAHVRDSQTIERSRVPDGLSETIASFAFLGDYAGNFTLCPPRKRWYYNFFGTSQFGGAGQNNLFSAGATFVYQTPSNAAPTFLEQPSSIFAPVNSTVSLSPVVEGSAPLFYQWRFQGEVLASETNETLVLNNVRNVAEGGYSVVVTNALGAITSAVANVTINYGASSSNTIALLSLTGTPWRYNQTGAFFNLGWTATNFNDGNWAGPGLGALAWEPGNANIQPLINTTLAIGRTSYYFRTYFNLASNFPAGTVLRATTLVDDGAVIYINGREIQRIRFGSTPATVIYTTLANSQPPSGDAVPETFFWAPTDLRIGTNVIAAEVHQNSIGSSDIVWGMSLDAIVPTPNRPPVITNQPISRVVSNGVSVAFNVGAGGTPPLTFQWRHDGTNVPGATATTLLLPNVGRQHAGVYTVMVSNRFDTVVSSNATLVVLVPQFQFVAGSTTFTAPGRFTLNFIGDAGAVFAIETSTNLLNWTQAGTVTNTTGAAEFHDNSAGGASMKFYRLRLVP